MRSLICFCMVLTVANSGCGVSLFVKPEEQAVVDEHVFSNKSFLPGWILAREGVHALSTKLERRLVLFDRRKKNGCKNEWELKVCAEPPAEAIQALDSVSKLEVELKKQLAENKSSTLSGTGDFGLTTAVQAAFRRTQGLQFYRDGAYQWCQAYLNGFIKKDKFLERLKRLEEKAALLITKEIEQPGFYVGTLPSINTVEKAVK